MHISTCPPCHHLSSFYLSPRLCQVNVINPETDQLWERRRHPVPFSVTSVPETTSVRSPCHTLKHKSRLNNKSQTLFQSCFDLLAHPWLRKEGRKVVKRIIRDSFPLLMLLGGKNYCISKGTLTGRKTQPRDYEQ